jgi:hypothetical protein
VARTILAAVATHDEKPWWELEGKAPPHDEQFEAEAERLRGERAHAYRQRLEQREQRRAHSSVPPPSPGR